MNIRVSGKRVEIGQALPQRVRDRLTAAVAKHFDRPAQANVTFMKERTGFRADCMVHLSSGALMHAHARPPMHTQLLTLHSIIWKSG